MNYIMAIGNPHDNTLLAEVLVDCRGVGEKTIQKTMRTSISLYEAVKRLSSTKPHEKTMKKAIQAIDDIQNTNQPVKYLIDSTWDPADRKYKSPLCQKAIAKMNDKEKSRSAHANVRALEKLLENYVPLNQENVSQLMEDIVGLEVVAGKKNAVMVTTGHGTKGDEWPVAFYPYMLDGLFPNTKSEYQEELRLFFVCASRATDKVFFTTPGDPSKFLDYVKDHSSSSSSSILFNIF